MKFDLTNLTRKNIKELKPYSSARHEFTGNAIVCLDANENAYGSPLDQQFNRYPDPLQWQLKFQLAKIKGVPAENIFIGNGSDEVIDLAYRIFCEPGKDNVIICPPTYGMYEVSANINAVEIRKVDLATTFQLDVEDILTAADSNTKLLFICSPNNPTGNSMNRADIKRLLEEFNGLIVIDEAYINYAAQKSFIEELTVYPNLIVMQTLSKAWGLAALRLGLAYASMDIIDLFNKVKPPYNVNAASQQLAIEALQNTLQVNDWITATVQQRKYLADQLTLFSFVKTVYPADANFLLIQVEDADDLYQYLTSRGIIIRNRSNEPGCANCLRITVGTPGENQLLLNTLIEYKK
jgi:histidinol-phosphate aminotransferase